MNATSHEPISDQVDYVAQIPNLSRPESSRAFPLGGCAVLCRYKCDLKCRHCYVRSSPTKKATMTYAQARRYFQSFFHMGAPADELHISGGEPFLDFPHLLEIVKAARESGFTNVGYVETNASWARDDVKIRERLLQLRDLGVLRLCISVDVFHQEWVALENVKRLIRMTEEVLGRNGVMLRWPSGLSRQMHGGQMSAADFQNYFKDGSRESPERLGGRGVDEVAPMLPHVPIEELDHTPCGRKMLHKRHFHVDPFGTVFVGIGCVALGNAEQSSIEEVFQTVSHEHNPLLSMLAREGPKGAVLAKAQRTGYQARRGYVSKCHLCYDIRRFFKGNGVFADELGPETWFSEER